MLLTKEMAANVWFEWRWSEVVGNTVWRAAPGLPGTDSGGFDVTCNIEDFAEIVAAENYTNEP